MTKNIKVVILAGGLGTRLPEYTKNSKADGENKRNSNNCLYNESLYQIRF